MLRAEFRPGVMLNSTLRLERVGRPTNRRDPKPSGDVQASRGEPLRLSGRDVATGRPTSGKASHGTDSAGLEDAVRGSAVTFRPRSRSESATPVSAESPERPCLPAYVLPVLEREPEMSYEELLLETCNYISDIVWHLCQAGKLTNHAVHLKVLAEACSADHIAPGGVRGSGGKTQTDGVTGRRSRRNRFLPPPTSTLRPLHPFPGPHQVLEAERLLGESDPHRRRLAVPLADNGKGMQRPEHGEALLWHGRQASHLQSVSS